MEHKFTISLASIEQVKAFVNSIYRFQSDIDLVSGRYIVDAKSIMGIFSLNLSSPITLIVYGDEEVDAINDVIKPFLVTEA
ncbi:MAG: HPr family phosphocarrier protein [Anaerostipes sp.]|nr:HPr family phosphocarrier protein [Anaerostipes sp.]